MKVDDIRKLCSKLNQYDALKKLKEKIDGRASDHWWNITIPGYEFNITEDATRERFKQWLDKEIEIISEELELEDVNYRKEVQK